MDINIPGLGNKKVEILYELKDKTFNRIFSKVKNEDVYIISFIKVDNKERQESDCGIKDIIIKNRKDILDYIDSDGWKNIVKCIGDKTSRNIDYDYSGHNDNCCYVIDNTYNFMYHCKYLLEYSDDKYGCILDMFNHDIEYPNNSLIMNGLQIDMMFSYISSDYLNGVINYINVFHSIMIRRYKPLEKTEQDISWEESCIKAKEKCTFHTNISDKTDIDDILILGETLDSYWFLWADCDGSDSNIGRIGKYHVKDRDELIEILHKSVPHIGHNNTEYIVLPEFQGWITL